MLYTLRKETCAMYLSCAIALIHGNCDTGRLTIDLGGIYSGWPAVGGNRQGVFPVPNLGLPTGWFGNLSIIEECLHKACRERNSYRTVMAQRDSC